VTVELEVSPSNRVSKRDFKPIAGAVVERVATSSCGQWMATVDVRFGGEESQSEIYLKFWSWDSSQGSWVLNTRINKPHGNNSILSMSFRPSCGHNAGLWLATCGEDGKLKIWRIRTTKTKNAGVEGMNGLFLFVLAHFSQNIGSQGPQ
jgi:NET1-associated nuclear protein 1 (U3 small nucleolar RNA-associated protein 17)